MKNIFLFVLQILLLLFVVYIEIYFNSDGRYIYSNLIVSLVLYSFILLSTKVKFQNFVLKKVFTTYLPSQKLRLLNLLIFIISVFNITDIFTNLQNYKLWGYFITIINLTFYLALIITLASEKENSILTQAR
jgi:hypothetical protein